MLNYCVDLLTYSRFKTREVKVGKVGIGGNNPIRVQSMTTVDTMDTEGSVEQSIRMIEAGCELVRITAPSKKEAENLRKIKEELRARGYDTPLVADIHFTPNAAEIAARIVEKVRVNPGNYADKKKFEEIEYTDASYQEELNRIEKKFSPLVQICKEENIAMRIGTNHGSLSDRILSRYGDTPKGMVESAMEFIRICEKHDYFNLILSMKASNTLVMVQAYRLLVHEMQKAGMNYPLHLGVTEAGDGEDGRIKSAVGIGTLLEDGLGDTIRVSLTEEPEFEIPVAQKLVSRFEKREKENDNLPTLAKNPINPFAYQRRETAQVQQIGSQHVPVVIGDLNAVKELKPSHFFGFGHQYSVPLDKWNSSDLAVDFIQLGENQIDFEIPGNLGIIQNLDFWQKDRARHYPIANLNQLEELQKAPSEIVFLELNPQELLANLSTSFLSQPNLVLILNMSSTGGVQAPRRAILGMIEKGIDRPVVLKNYYEGLEEENFQLNASCDFGALLIDGLGDGLWIQAKNSVGSKIQTSTAFGILQATRTRISKTEYISCPSCGRTLFDLQETTAKIRKVTSHLKGVKIGIMGCIVNGPGEMADADYGYVGTGPGKITLYKEKTVVERNVPETEAVNALINLIKEHGDWVEAEH